MGYLEYQSDSNENNHDIKNHNKIAASGSLITLRYQTTQINSYGFILIVIIVSVSIKHKTHEFAEDTHL